MKKKFGLLLLVLMMTLGLGSSVYADSDSCVAEGAYQYGNHPVTGEIEIVRVGMKNESGKIEWVDVFNEQGERLWKRVVNHDGEWEWVKVSDVPTDDEIRQRVNNKTGELEQTYGIKIVFEKELTGAEYVNTQLDCLLRLEEAIKAIPAELYSSVRAQLAARGKTLTVCFFQGGWSGDGETGAYYADTVTIKLDAVSATVGITFAHEYGHMLHLTLLDSSAIKSRWTALNGDMKYGQEIDPNGGMLELYGDEFVKFNKTFVREYAFTNYLEDFAESFAYFVQNPEYIQQMATGDPECPVVQKTILLREILSEAFSVDPSVFPPIQLSSEK